MGTGHDAAQSSARPLRPAHALFDCQMVDFPFLGMGCPQIGLKSPLWGFSCSLQGNIHPFAGMALRSSYKPSDGYIHSDHGFRPACGHYHWHIGLQKESLRGFSTNVDHPLFFHPSINVRQAFTLGGF